MSRSTAGVAVKVYRPSTSLAEIESEIEALSRTDSDHLLRLVDVTTASDRKPALILSPVGVRRLSDLVVGNRGLSLGEVVTATAPIVGAVAELHRVGISHGAVKLSNIVFDRRGTPVLVGFGKAELMGGRPADATAQTLPPAAASESPGIAADLADLAVVIRCVCAASSVDTDSLTDWLDALPYSVDPTGWLGRLEDALYDLAPGEPVRFDGPLATTAPEVAIGSGIPALATEEVARGGVDRTPVAHGERRAALIESRDTRRTLLGQTIGLPEPILELLRTPAPATVKRLAEAARTVRRPFWLAGAVVAAVLVAALVFVPDDGRAPANAVQPQEDVSSSPAAGELTESMPMDGSADDRSMPTAQGASDDSAAIRNDDPLVALEALIPARTQCLDARSRVCLERVDQAGSAAWDADSTFLEREESGQASGPILRSASGFVVTDRLGDSAIASAMDGATSTSFTVLLIREADGWRIRDIIAP